MNFDRYLVRKLDGHPVYSYVDMFYKKSKSNTIQLNRQKQNKKQLFTHSFKKDFNMISKNLLITSNNPLISKAISKEYDCDTETQWITVPKHISEILMVDMVVLMNTYCDLISREQYWDLYYICPPSIPLSTFRQFVQLGDGDEEEEDMSLKP